MYQTHLFCVPSSAPALLLDQYRTFSYARYLANVSHTTYTTNVNIPELDDTTKTMEAANTTEESYQQGVEIGSSFA
jgi:hypothetical protein